MIKIWQNICNIENKNNPDNINNCIEEKLYNTQCRDMPIIKSTCSYADSYADADAYKNVNKEGLC